MAKILTPLLRKLPSLSSTKLMCRCKHESIVESYTTENGRYFEKECKPERISDAQKECSVEKDFSCVSVQNMSATSSTLRNNGEPVKDGKGSEASGTASEATDMASAPKDKPRKWSNAPEVPTNCCMTGCPNCVWLKFAEDMMEFSVEGGAEARKIIEEMDDQSLKTFLLLELDNMQKM